MKQSFENPYNSKRMKKISLWTLGVLLLVFALFCYFRFWFVFGEGVKSGELNYVVRKGVLFKTYEGKLIQSGIRSKTAGAVGSYEFEFSVVDRALAEQLMLLGGRTLELHYKEYFGALPWRGFTKFVVDSIIAAPEMTAPAPAVPGAAAAQPAPATPAAAQPAAAAAAGSSAAETAASESSLQTL